MSTTYRASRRDQRIADEFLDGHGPCAFCGNSAPKDELANFGARCRPCYDAYCRGDRLYPQLSPQQRRAMADQVRSALSGRLRISGREHIAQLQARADAGEAMSPGQHGFLQAVRRAAGLPDEPRQALPAEPAVTAVAPMPAADHLPPLPEEIPPWVLDDIPPADDVEFPAANASEPA